MHHAWTQVAFIAALNAEVAKFNAFFEELEEDSVIRLQALTDELAAVCACCCVLYSACDAGTWQEGSYVLYMLERGRKGHTCCTVRCCTVLYCLRIGAGWCARCWCAGQDGVSVCFDLCASGLMRQEGDVGVVGPAVLPLKRSGLAGALACVLLPCHVMLVACWC